MYSDRYVALHCCQEKYLDEIKLKGALHLELALKKDKDYIQKVDYQLTRNENIALLTGANSGGKTTLLETLTQISIMAQMGLPVSADKAEIKIVDEIHIATYSHVFLDMMAPIQDTLYLSATPARSNPNEDYCMKKAFAELPQYGQEVREFQTKYLNTIYVFYDTHPKYYEIKSCTSFYGFNTKNYAKHLFENPDACNQVMSILQWALETTLQAIDDDEKIVIILELKDHIKLVKRELERLFPGVSIGDYSSNVDKSVKSDMLRNKIILSTDKSFGTGADLRGKLRVLINTITYSSKVTANQLPGRLRNIPNKKVYYIDLVNMGFKRAYDHYFRRSKIINKFSLTVQHRTLGKDI